MTWRIDGPERNLPPPEFQDRLTFVGGINRYDEPNFKIAWAQYETYAAGGVWSVDEAHYSGYRRLLSGSGEPCWTLYQWHAPEEYACPESYYVSNYDESTGLQTLGEYPYSGRYEVLYNLRFNDITNGRIEFFALPLNNLLFDLIVPIVMLAKDVSIEKRRTAYLEARASEEKGHTDEIERKLREDALPFTTAVSYTHQGIRSTLIDQKMLAMQRAWGDMTKAARSFHPGLQTR